MKDGMEDSGGRKLSGLGCPVDGGQKRVEARVPGLTPARAEQGKALGFSFLLSCLSASLLLATGKREIEIWFLITKTVAAESR
jgi:hypothetical protein